jgi:hypothetical protein
MHTSNNETRCLWASRVFSQRGDGRRQLANKARNGYKQQLNTNKSSRKEQSTIWDGDSRKTPEEIKVHQWDPKRRRETCLIFLLLFAGQLSFVEDRGGSG